MRSTAKPLFSEHYLTRRLPETRYWNVEFSQPLANLQKLYRDQEAYLQTYNEAQTEEHFIKPVLNELGFAYEVQTQIYSRGRQQADYTLFANEQSRRQACSSDEQEAFFSRALAMAEAKSWERALGEKSKNDDNNSPSFQIVGYLDGTRVNWGILTNGRKWRLYYRLSRLPVQEFYEVDLVDLLENREKGDFKYFWLFFRKDAFVVDPQGNCFLDRVLQESGDYARLVGEKLEELVFHEVVPEVAGGFVRYIDKQGTTVDHQELYKATLSFLYKILFLLYAEARRLLPIDSDSGYKQYSLAKILKEIADQVDKKQELSETLARYYERLLGLFEIIDGGDPSLNVPAYNGGLFKVKGEETELSPENRFLLRYRVTDAVLAPALDKLARINKEWIDYGFIGVRELGAIYEKLLEYKIIVEDAKVGKVRLESDKAERKQTGSYYTPDYIVQYIVENTLEPIIKERKEQFRELIEQIAEKRKHVQDGRNSTQTIRGLNKVLTKLERQAWETLLDIKVCDPAMGSGHFLVATVDFITYRLIRILNDYPEKNPVLDRLQQMREQILENLQAQEIPVDRERLSDDNLLHRAVMKRCIYGVDLNPMAVELAKVSLWLHSFTVGAPLSFLDHHLRCGNSLIGTTVREAEKQMNTDKGGQLSLLQGPFAGLLSAANVMREITNLSDATFQEVKQSSFYFKKFDEEATPYKQLLDVLVSQFFKVKGAKNFLERYGNSAVDMLRQGLEGMNEQDTEIISSARQLYEEKRFFHWDLEFPEIFINLENASWKENPGFDAVIGNPPYVSVTNINKEERYYLSENYNTAVGRVDIYIPFIEKNLNLLRTQGMGSFITPNKYFVYGYGEQLRLQILTKSSIQNLVDLAKVSSVFPEASIYTSIIVFQKNIHQHQKRSNNTINTYIFKKDNPKHIEYLNSDFNHNVVEYNTLNQNLFLKTPKYVFSLRFNYKRANVYFKSLKSGQILDKICYIEQCIRIGNKEKRQKLIVTPYQLQYCSNEIAAKAKKVIDADELDKYFVNWKKRYLIYDKNKLYNPKTEKLFKQPKIFVKDTSKQLLVSLDLNIENPYFALNTIYAIYPKTNTNLHIGYIATILNSSISDFLYKLLFGALTIRGGYIRFREYLQYLPIPEISFITPLEARTEIFNQLTAFYSDKILQDNIDPIMTLVKEQINCDRTDIIHDFLAFLAEQMLNLNQQKQKETKDFLSYLEREIGTKIENLTNKTKIRNYLGDYQKQETYFTFEEFLGILKSNKRKLQIDPSEREIQERLDNEYQNSIDTLIPIKNQLQNTDRLIDRIVYQLYGLTEEEIAVIEGDLQKNY